ncbi:MAG: serine protease [Thermodesulfobacteriota bacterium]|nr:serine protease [Thermodesulfobacteriota bacterium]
MVDTDKEKDLALLKIKACQKLVLQPLPISKDTVYKMGQDVYTIGFPLSDILGNSPRLNKGLVSSAVGLKDNPDHLQISVETQSGNIGSPLLNENGSVVGIIQGTLNPMNVLARTGGNLPQNVNFAAKTNIFAQQI